MMKLNIKLDSRSYILSAYVLLFISAIVAFYFLLNFIYLNVYLVITNPESIEINSGDIKISDINTTEFNQAINKINAKTNKPIIQNLKNIF